MPKKLHKLVSETPSYEGRVGIVYLRVSSKRQETEGSGLSSQEERCKQFLHSKGVSYDSTFSDSFTGGGDFMKRPAMNALLAKVDSNPHKKYVVVFDDLKRFARDTKFHWELRTAFKTRDIIPNCLNHEFDESEEGQFVETILAAQNELERKQNRRQVIQKQKARLERGYWAFGSKTGYKQTPDSIHGTLSIPTREGIEIIKPAFEAFSTGNLLHKIDLCKFLVEKGLWKKQSPEKYLDKVTTMLKDPFYMGDIEYLPWEVTRRKGHHEGIISLETFDMIQKRLKNEGLNKRIRRDMSSEFEHRGLLICDGCDSHLTGGLSKSRNQERHPYYFCQKKGCEFYKKSIKREDVEIGFKKVLKSTHSKAKVDKVVSIVFERVWSEEIGGLKHQEAFNGKKIAELEESVEQLLNLASKTKSEQVRDAYEIQIEKAMNELKQLKSQKNIEKLDLSIPYRTALDKVMGLLKSPYEIWFKMEVKERHELFYFIFEAKLPYNLKTGYRTDKIQSYTRLFEDFVAQNTTDVEMGGIEPPCR